MSRDLQPKPALQCDSFVGWRQRTLVAAGFEVALAGRLAGDPRFDLHALLELVDAGCPRELAARILAPLGGDWETAT